MSHGNHQALATPSSTQGNDIPVQPEQDQITPKGDGFHLTRGLELSDEQLSLRNQRMAELGMIEVTQSIQDRVTDINRESQTIGTAIADLYLKQKASGAETPGSFTLNGQEFDVNLQIDQASASAGIGQQLRHGECEAYIVNVCLKGEEGEPNSYLTSFRVSKDENGKWNVTSDVRDENDNILIDQDNAFSPAGDLRTYLFNKYTGTNALADMLKCSQTSDSSEVATTQVDYATYYQDLPFTSSHCPVGTDTPLGEKIAATLDSKSDSIKVYLKNGEDAQGWFNRITTTDWNAPTVTDEERRLAEEIIGESIGLKGKFHLIHDADPDGNSTTITADFTKTNQRPDWEGFTTNGSGFIIYHEDSSGNPEVILVDQNLKTEKLDVKRHMLYEPTGTIPEPDKIKLEVASDTNM
jgi:hypothetical protein